MSRGRHETSGTAQYGLFDAGKAELPPMPPMYSDEIKRGDKAEPKAGPKRKKRGHKSKPKTGPFVGKEEAGRNNH